MRAQERDMIAPSLEEIDRNSIIHPSSGRSQRADDAARREPLPAQADADQAG